MTNDYSSEGVLADIVRSHSDGESIRDWWERAHHRDHQVLLTGSAGQDEVWPRLGVLDRLVPCAVVLNIGVGLGQCTRELAARGCVVDVLDISEYALSRVADVTRATYLASSLCSLPSDTYDVAMSHLVAQHMLDVDLETQIREVVRSLKANGIFAVQFATSMLPGERDQDEASAKGGSIQRSPAAMEKLVSRAGGRVALSQPREQFTDHQAGWHVVHIARSGV